MAHPVLLAKPNAVATPLPVRQPMLQAPLDPSFGLVSGVTSNVINGIANTVYATDGARYAFEQTLGYTVPRTMGQLFRTKKLTGENNPQAAKEMFERDTLADFEDTFLPGLLATLAIGKGLDAAHGGKTLVQHNIALDHLEHYQAIAQAHPDEASFFNQLEAQLHHAAGSVHPLQPLGLQETVAALARHESGKDAGYYWQATTKALTGGMPDPKADAVQALAGKLGLKRLDVYLSRLSIPASPAPPNGLNGRPIVDQGLHVDLHHLLTDLTHIKQRNQWGTALADSLGKTADLKGWQAVATGAALLLSLQTPKWIREKTRKETGVDEFPGTRPIEQHYRKYFKLPDEFAAKPPASRDDKCHPFPYLTEAWKHGNKWPTVFSVGFLGAIGGIVAHDIFNFDTMKPKFANGKQLLETYAYERAFPWTPVKQMAVTYGLLCGLRVANARNDNEFRELAVKDALLGWLTLTYFFPMARNLMANDWDAKVQQHLMRHSLMTADHQNQVEHLLTKLEAGTGRNGIPPRHVLREKAEMSPALVKNVLGVTEEVAQKISTHLQNTHNLLTVGTGALSIFLIAVAEPQIGIWITNHLERQKWETLAKAYFQQQNALKDGKIPSSAEATHSAVHPAAQQSVTAPYPAAVKTGGSLTLAALPLVPGGRASSVEAWSPFVLSASTPQSTPPQSPKSPAASLLQETQTSQTPVLPGNMPGAISNRPPVLFKQPPWVMASGGMVPGVSGTQRGGLPVFVLPGPSDYQAAL
jgi:hypothetical protein